jgi:hypothetical protein
MFSGRCLAGGGVGAEPVGMFMFSGSEVLPNAFAGQLKIYNVGKAGLIARGSGQADCIATSAGAIFRLQSGYPISFCLGAKALT